MAYWDHEKAVPRPSHVCDNLQEALSVLAQGRCLRKEEGSRYVLAGKGTLAGNSACLRLKRYERVNLFERGQLYYLGVSILRQPSAKRGSPKNIPKFKRQNEKKTRNFGAKKNKLP